MIITRYRGDTSPIRGFAGLNSLPLNATGCSFSLTVDPSRAPLDASANLFTLIGTVDNALTGEISFPVTLEQSDRAPGKYYYDIQMTDGFGYKTTIALDRFVLLQDITK